MEINSFEQRPMQEPILKDYLSIKKYLYNTINDGSNDNSKIDSISINNNKNNLSYLKQENLRLKFCLNNIKNFFDKEIKSKMNYINKQNQQLNDEKKTLDNNNSIIKELQEKIKNYEKLIEELNVNKSTKMNTNKNINNNKNKYEFINSLQEENEQLKQEIKSKDKLIESVRNEINLKKGLFKEINKIKKEMSNIISTMESLNSEIEEKDKIIKELKDDTIQKNRNKIQIKEKEILIKQLKESQEKTKEMTNEFESIKLKLIELKNEKEKIQELSKNSNQILQNSKETKEKLKNEYENNIQSIMNEYEQKLKSESEKENEIFDENEYIPQSQDEKLLLEENEKIKQENDDLMNKINDLPNLKKKYNELVETFNQVREENNLLKITSNSNSIARNTFSSNKKNVSILENESNIYNKVYGTDVRKEKMNKTLNNHHMSEELSSVIYYKKKPKQKSMNSSREYPKNMKVSYNMKNYYLPPFKLNDNEAQPENAVNIANEKPDNFINESFNLYKPIKEGLLSFNLSKKNYNLVVPENYESFWNNFEPEKSIQYNTLEGLFIINSKDNQLYYYSSKKNSFCELFYFNYDHKDGCLFLDNLSKNIIAIGGINTTAVEKFSFETGNMEDLPELSTHRYKMSCCQVGNKVYCFFGLCLERNNESLIEYLDMDNINQGWVELVYQNKTSFNLLTYMSCVNLNDCELLIIGGLIEDNVPNQKLLYYNVQKNEFIELNKDLPDSDVKKYLFSKNIMFNLFLKDEVISFTNIDDNNQVHILDNELKYDLYLAPKL